MSGVTKEIQPSGYIKLRFLNGDWKVILSDGNESFFFAQRDILVLKDPDGTTVERFNQGGKTVTRYKDGTVNISRV